MVQTTPKAGLRYPEATDNVNLWEHFENLAEDVDGALRVRACKLVAQTAQSIPDGVDTVLTFTGSSEEYDTEGWHSTSVNTSRITVNKAGLYQVRAHLTFTFSTTFLYGDPAIRKNGAVYVRSGNFAPTTANNVNKHGGQITEDIVAANGDYFEMSALQNSTGDVAQTLQTAAGGTRFSVRYLGPV